MPNELLKDILTENTSHEVGLKALDEKVQSKLTELRKDVAERIFS